MFFSHSKLKIQNILNFDNLTMTSSLITSVWQIFWESFILTYFFVFLIFFGFKYDNSEEKAKNSYQLFSFLQILFFTLCTSILINESITMFGYSIQSSQINCSSVWCFSHTNFWRFEHFVFNLLFSFSLSDF